jgi:hypothetical protein
MILKKPLTLKGGIIMFSNRRMLLLAVLLSGVFGTLGAVSVAQAVMPVKVDVKPRSCPNALNVNSRGVLPVAILGSDSLDVTDIDPATTKLVEVAPLRWARKDVATAYNGAFLEGALDCTTAGRDGFDDLVLFFDRREVVAAIGEVSDGEVLELTVTGDLWDGTLIEGYDFVVIRKKGL